MKALLPALALAVLSQPGMHSDGTRTELDEVTEVPFDGEGKPIVTVEIPGHGEGRFLVDTGASKSLIDEEWAEELELPRKELDGEVDTLGGEELHLSAVAHIARLEIGEAVVRDLYPPILDLRQNGEIDGVIGQDLLRTWLVLFDGPGRRLILMPTGDIDDSFDELFTEKVPALLLEPDWSRGIPFIERQVEDIDPPVEWLIATGADFLALPSETIEELELESIGSDEETDVYEVRGLSLNGLWLTGRLFEADHGILGWTLWDDYVLVQDGESERMYVLVNPPWE